MAAVALVLVAAVVLLRRPDELVVVTELDRFRPERIEAPVGGAVLVRNHDWYAHTFTVQELGISTYLPPHGERRIELPNVAGTYRLTCEVPGHGGMVGSIHLGPLETP